MNYFATFYGFTYFLLTHAWVNQNFNNKLLVYTSSSKHLSCPVLSPNQELKTWRSQMRQLPKQLFILVVIIQNLRLWRAMCLSPRCICYLTPLDRWVKWSGKHNHVVCGGQTRQADNISMGSLALSSLHPLILCDVKHFHQISSCLIDFTTNEVDCQLAMLLWGHMYAITLWSYCY